MAGSKTSNHQILLGICSRSAPVALHASLASCGHFFVLLVVVYMQTPCNARTRIEMEHMPAKCDTDCCILYSYIPTPCTTFAPQTYFHRVLRAGAHTMMQLSGFRHRHQCVVHQYCTGTPTGMATWQSPAMHLPANVPKSHAQYYTTSSRGSCQRIAT